MKKFDKWNQRQFDQVKPETFNNNIGQTLQNYNGHLDSQNLPVNSINCDKLVKPTAIEALAGETRAITFKGQTQDIYQARFLSAEEGGINDWLADKQIVLQTDQYTSGWNRLASYIDKFYLDIEATEGILYGHFQVNHFYGAQTYRDLSSVAAEWGKDWWIRWGLFLNDNLIADTGNLYPRAEANVVPFKAPIGSQEAFLDLRWMVVTSNPDTATMFTPSEDITGYVEVYGANIWAINQKK